MWHREIEVKIKRFVRQISIKRDRKRERTWHDNAFLLFFSLYVMLCCITCDERSESDLLGGLQYNMNRFAFRNAFLWQKMGSSSSVEIDATPVVTCYSSSAERIHRLDMHKTSYNTCWISMPSQIKRGRKQIFR